MTMNESAIEKAVVQSTKDMGGIAYKFVSPGRCFVPDRLILLPVPEVYRPIVARYVQFVEVKASGKGPSSGQVREIKRLRKLGYAASVWDGETVEV